MAAPTMTQEFYNQSKTAAPTATQEFQLKHYTSPLAPSKTQQYRQLCEETPEPEPLKAEELHDAGLVDLKRRWIAFAAMVGHQDWRALIKTLSYENKGLGEAFVRYLMRRAELQGNPNQAESAIRVHIRKLGGLYRKYKGVRREPKNKPIMGSDFFIYHLYYRWVRDTSAFPIGLDRIDDVCLRQFYMYTGCRKHELIYAKPRDLEAKVKEYDEESDAYTDVDCTTDEYIKPRVKTCWVCDEPDECDNNPKLKVLCWEDVNLGFFAIQRETVAETAWACRFFSDTTRARTKNRADLVYLCRRETPSPPITHILAKALAEGVIANEGYQTKADPFFATKLNKRALKIRWKKEWLHKPVFRKTHKVLKEESEFEKLCAKINSIRKAAYESVRSAKRGLFNLWRWTAQDIKAYVLTSDYDTYQQGAAEYRNGRDWAKQQRDEAIEQANREGC
ncbi:hypothetical protein B0T25DRAFT_564309 [Lasiosphaeria hispida]|uniref:FluG domain-containing protein n=1 Tax=Lasiosphaeria hispida TaxID=260671 RepID=A0AAJ0HPX5_9PEZI|nr:hypothetical protein B0T25DRAFT_564309 [Lasiosphaeria hispida]